MLRILFVIASLSFPASALAQPRFPQELASIEEYLLDEAYEEVERAFSGMHSSAQKSRDYSQLRKVYEELFASPNQDRIEHTETWSARLPDSLYANTAMAWVHHGKSWFYRDRYAASLVSRQGNEKFKQERKRAAAAVQRSLTIDPNFPPALDAAAIIAQTNGRMFGADALLARLFEHAPDVQSLKIALNTYSLRWGHPAERSAQVCEHYAPLVPNFTPDTCFVMFVFVNELEGEPRERAIEVLAEQTNPALDWIRSDVYLREWSSKPEAEEELIRIFWKELSTGNSLRDQIGTIEVINRKFDRPFFAAEARQEAIAHHYNRFKLHPHSYWIARELLEQLSDNPRAVGDLFTAADIAESWSQMHRLSEYSGAFWRFSAGLARSLAGPYSFDAQRDFYANTIYFGNHHSTYLESAMVHYHWLYRSALAARETYPELAQDPEELKEDLLCEVVRASRLFEQSCSLGGPHICNMGGAFDIERNEIRRLWSEATNCSFAAPRPFEDLRYSPKSIPRSFFEDLNLE